MPIRFEPALDPASQALASGMIDAILRATDPAAAFMLHFDPSNFDAPTHILSVGKASIPMTHAAIEMLGNRFARATVISTPALCAKAQFKNKFVDLLAGDHPLPSPQSIHATAQLIEHARSIPADHHALVLISGGGSSLLCAPKQGVTLGQIIDTTNALLAAGKPIQEINRQRSQLDALKAGGLADLLAHVRHTECFVLSDVIGDDLQTIASGPALAPSIPHTIIANNHTAIDALCAWIAHEHIELVDVRRDAIGFAHDEGKELAHTLRSHRSHTPHTPIAVCLGGEPTVDASHTSGTGGPMLELALACGIELTKARFRWTIITFATDGIDGPTNAAGAIITSQMLKDPTTRSRVQQALDNHDTLPMCDSLGATIRTAHTGTNVNDIAIAIRFPQ